MMTKRSGNRCSNCRSRGYGNSWVMPGASAGGREQSNHGLITLQWSWRSSLPRSSRQDEPTTAARPRHGQATWAREGISPESSKVCGLPASRDRSLSTLRAADAP
jgi:hypothetical protein